MPKNITEEFTSLLLNRDLIEASIKEELNGESIIVSKSENSSQVFYKFKIDGQLDALLNIYLNKDGSTSLVYKTGKNHEFSKRIATKIVEKCKIKSYKFNSFYIKAIRDEDFTVMIDFLKENCQAEIIEQRPISHGFQFRIKSRQGDVLSFNKFDNNALQVQGKPLLLFSETIEILSDLLPLRDVIEQQMQFYATNITAKTVIGELENIIPTAFSKLDKKLISIMSPSVALRKQSFELDDYTVLVFPILRGLEGVIKQLFRDHDILIEKNTSFGDYFVDTPRGAVLKQEFKQQIDSIVTCDELCKLYQYFRKNRHTLFHVEGTVTPTKIIKRVEAIKIIEDTLNLIEETFVSLN